MVVYEKKGKACDKLNGSVLGKQWASAAEATTQREKEEKQACNQKAARAAGAFFGLFS